MRLALFAVGLGVAMGLSLGACNAVLGIGEASPEPSEAGSSGSSGSTQGSAGQNATLTCANYCALMNKECTGNNAEYIPTAPTVCSQLCSQFKTTNVGVTDETISLAASADPSQNAATADTLNCRLWHVNFAISQMDPMLHCPHAGALGGDKCGDACQAFCELDAFFCSGALKQYGSISECLNACRPDAGYPGYRYAPGDPEAVGVANVMGGNSLECRMYHLQASLDPSGEGKAFHCPHTGQISATCFDPGGDAGAATDADPDIDDY